MVNIHDNEQYLNNYQSILLLKVETLFISGEKQIIKDIEFLLEENM